MGFELFEGIIDKNNLSEMLKAFHYTTGLATYLMSSKGEIVLQFGPTYPYCTYVYSHIPESICQQVRVSAGKKAMEIGSSYIFTCHANMNHIAFPIICQGTFLGSIQVGPFLMNAPESSLVMDIRERYSEFTMEDLMTLYDDAADIPQISAEKVTQLSRLFYYLMSSIITDSKDRFIINQQKLMQQSKISESIQKFKNEEGFNCRTYPIEKEKELLGLMRKGNTSTAKAVLNEILSSFFYEHGNNLSVIRVRMIELGSVMLHSMLDMITDSEKIFLLGDHFIHDMPGISNQDELAYRMNELFENIMECRLPMGNETNRMISKAMDYIGKHFSENITLQALAKEVSLNPSYLSRVFKQVTGKSFKEYLNNVRIEEAKRLIRYTDYPLLDIAIAVGYDSQSYFSQIFKKETGLTPNQFRA